MSHEDLNEFPTRTADHVGETESINSLHMVLKDPNFLLRTLGERDYGVDLTLEVLLEGNPSNWTTTIQVKSTTGKLNADGSLSLQVDRTNLNYMLSAPHSLYIIYHRESRMFRYRFAQQVLDDCRKTSLKWRTQDQITVRCRDPLSAETSSALHRLLSTYFRQEKTVRTSGPYDSFLDKLEHAAQGQEQLDAAIAAVMREALLHYTRGRGLIGDTKYTNAVERLRDAQRLALVTGDLRFRSQIEVALGGALVFLGCIPEAIEMLNSALSNLLPSESVEDRAHVAFAYGNLALARDFQGYFDESRALIGKAISILEDDAGDVFTLASMYLFNAQNLLRKGEVDDDVDALLNSFFACLDRIPPLEAALLLAAAWGVYGNQQLNIWGISKDAADLHTARTYFGRAQAVAEHYQIMDLILQSRHSLAQCVWFEGDSERARALFLEVAANAQASGYILIELNARHNAAGILLCMENIADALPEVHAVKRGYEKLGGHPNLDKINILLSTLEQDGQQEKLSSCHATSETEDI